MSQPRYAATCEAPLPQPMPESRERRRSGSRRRVHVKRRSPAPLHRERASDVGVRPRPFDLDELERRDEDKKQRYALLKPQPMMRHRSRSTGDSSRPIMRDRDYRGDPLRAEVERPRAGNLAFLGDPPHRHSADDPRPSMSEITGDLPPASLFEPMFVRIQELDIADEGRPSQQRPPPPASMHQEDTNIPQQEDADIAVDDRQDISELQQFCVRKLVRATALCREKSASQTPNGLKAWEKMADTLGEHTFALNVWAAEAEIDYIGPHERREESVRTAEVALRRLGLRSSRILGLISNGSPRLVPIPEELKLADVEGEKSDEEGESKLPGPQLTPSRQMGQEIKGLGLQLRTLRRLTRSIRDTQRPEGMATLASHVKDVQDLFGSEEAVQRHGVGGNLPADAALKKARDCTAHGSAALTIPSIVVN